MKCVNIISVYYYYSVLFVCHIVRFSELVLRHYCGYFCNHYRQEASPRMRIGLAYILCVRVFRVTLLLDSR